RSGLPDAATGLRREQLIEHSVVQRGEAFRLQELPQRDDQKVAVIRRARGVSHPSPEALPLARLQCHPEERLLVIAIVRLLLDLLLHYRQRGLRFTGMIERPQRLARSAGASGHPARAPLLL